MTSRWTLVLVVSPMGCVVIWVSSLSSAEETKKTATLDDRGDVERGPSELRPRKGNEWKPTQNRAHTHLNTSELLSGRSTRRHWILGSTKFIRTQERPTKCVNTRSSLRNPGTTSLMISRHYHRRTCIMAVEPVQCCCIRQHRVTTVEQWYGRTVSSRL